MSNPEFGLENHTLCYSLIPKRAVIALKILAVWEESRGNHLLSIIGKPLEP